MEYFVIVLFALILLISMVLEISLLYALLLGYVVFFAYGIYKGCSAKSLFLDSWDKTKSIGNMLFLFCLIGVLTATWRASGTIAFIVVLSESLLIPQIFIFVSFFLCLIISMLTGTSFGSSATMGVICMIVGNVFGMDPALLGGAILSGCYFGDRLSPMSTCAMLIAKITYTDIYTNLKNMSITAIIPLILTSFFYLFLGFDASHKSCTLDTFQVFRTHFNLSWLTVFPIVVLIVSTFCKMPIRNTMLLGTLSAILLCFFVQNQSLTEILELCIKGFESENSDLNRMLGGGGLLSMLTVSCIVGISSSYMGLFYTSGLLENLKGHIEKLSEKISVFSTTVLVATMTSMITCNQTLTILMTKMLCETQYTSKEELALALEDSAVLIPGIIPWSIACSVILVNINAPMESILYGFFLYLLPLVEIVRKRKKAYTLK